MVEVMHSMERHENDADRTIEFLVNLKVLGVLDQLKFIQYVEVRFDGERLAVGQTIKGELYPFGTLALRFSHATYAAAKDFCDEQLLSNGLAKSDFRRVLDNADLSEEVNKDLLWKMMQFPNNPYQLDKMSRPSRS